MWWGISCCTSYFVICLDIGTVSLYWTFKMHFASSEFCFTYTSAGLNVSEKVQCMMLYDILLSDRPVIWYVAVPTLARSSYFSSLSCCEPELHSTQMYVCITEVSGFKGMSLTCCNVLLLESAPILWWLCPGICVCVCGWVCGCVSMIKGNPQLEWIETWHVTNPRHFVQAYWFRVQKVRVRVWVGVGIVVGVGVRVVV